MNKGDLEITVDFYADWIQMLRDELGAQGYKVSSDEDPFEVCKKYFNVQRRQIPSKPRKVLISKEFTCPPKYQTAVDIIKDKATKGEDLTPHLSKCLLDADYNDSLLNDWGIHHFHLGTVPDPEDPRFVERTGLLLFARVTSDHFYMIDVMLHGDWTRRRLIEILHANWPDSLSMHRMRGVTGLSQDISEDDIREFRRHGVMTLIELSNGTVYAPLGGGYATSGVSIEVVRQCDYFRYLTNGLEEKVKREADRLVAHARAQGVRIGQQLHFRLQALSCEGALVTEENSGASFQLPLPDQPDSLSH